MSPPPRGPDRSRLAVVGLAAVVVALAAVLAVLVLAGDDEGDRATDERDRSRTTVDRRPTPTEVSVNEFARASCEDVLKPKYEEIDQLFDDVEDEEDITTPEYAQAAIDATRKMVELLQETAEEYGDFSDDHILEGSDGETFREEVATAVSDYVEDLDGVLDDVDRLDPADEEDVVPDIQEIFMDLGGLDIDTDSDEPGGEVLQETTEDDEDCGGLLAIMIYGRSYGE